MAPQAMKKVVVRCTDGEEFELEQEIASMSGIIKCMIEDDCVDKTVPIQVTGPVLTKIIAYWKQHNDPDADPEALKAFDEDFVKVERDEMFELIIAANYLNSPPLLDLLCQAVADTIKNMSVEEVREYFDIKNDYTPEEEAMVRAENSWAFDD